MMKQSKKKQSDVALGMLSGLLKPIVDRYIDLPKDDQYIVRDYIRKFNRAYAFVTQIIKLHDRDLFNEFLFTSYQFFAEKKDGFY